MKLSVGSGGGLGSWLIYWRFSLRKNHSHWSVLVGLGRRLISVSGKVRETESRNHIWSSMPRKKNKKWSARNAVRKKNINRRNLSRSARVGWNCFDNRVSIDMPALDRYVATYASHIHRKLSRAEWRFYGCDEMMMVILIRVVIQINISSCPECDCYSIPVGKGIDVSDGDGYRVRWLESNQFNAWWVHFNGFEPWQKHGPRWELDYPKWLKSMKDAFNSMCYACIEFHWKSQPKKFCYIWVYRENRLNMRSKGLSECNIIEDFKLQKKIHQIPLAKLFSYPIAKRTKRYRKTE